MVTCKSSSSGVVASDSDLPSNEFLAPRPFNSYAKSMIKTHFDAWVDGFQNACDEIKNELIAAKCETQLKDFDPQDLLDIILKLKREAFSRAPTLPLDLPNTDALPSDAHAKTPEACSSESTETERP
ncbi:MAG: hypothetical protein KDD45_07735 [Bdellovibrionales bacterium]|nr:hypothetical protein [Bdellovibrionales bacterium]